jgi:hypothetical protein
MRAAVTRVATVAAFSLRANLRSRWKVSGKGFMLRILRETGMIEVGSRKT